MKVQDAGLIQLTDPADIQAHQALNVVDPSCVTVTIDDNDGMFNNLKVCKCITQGKIPCSYRIVTNWQC